MTVKSKIAVIIAVCAVIFAGVTAEAEDYADLVERVMPSIVLIKTDTGTGSGFFVSSEGDILTNYHVVDGARFITVALQNGNSLQASLKSYDTKKDIALLAVNVSYSVKFLKISAKLPRIGEAVIAISSPRGLIGTVTNGIVSAFRDNKSWVQFTAPVSPGSSGGALINTKGEIIGMPTWIRADAGSQNLNFAIASPVLARFLSYAINKPAISWTRPIPSQPKTAQRPKPKPQPKPKRSKKSAKKGSGIPLPDAKGFLVHKWGCSVESIRRYVSSPLIDIINSGVIFTTNKSFKAFNAKIDTVVWYCFIDDKLDKVRFNIKDKRNNALLQSIIAKELTGLYGMSPEEEYIGERYLDGIRLTGYISHKWSTKGLTVQMRYFDSGELILLFGPR